MQKMCIRDRDEPNPSPRELAFSRAARFSPPPPRKKPPLWALAGAAVLALGLVIFLGRSLKFGGDTNAVPDELPDIYGNLREDGTTWVECESREYQGCLLYTSGLPSPQQGDGGHHQPGARRGGIHRCPGGGFFLCRQIFLFSSEAQPHPIAPFFSTIPERVKNGGKCYL